MQSINNIFLCLKSNHIGLNPSARPKYASDRKTPGYISVFNEI